MRTEDYASLRNGALISARWLPLWTLLEGCLRSLWPHLRTVTRNIGPGVERRLAWEKKCLTYIKQSTPVVYCCQHLFQSSALGIIEPRANFREFNNFD